MTKNWAELIKDWTSSQQTGLESMMNDLHGLAEISWEEVRTSAYICQRLQEIGMEVTRFPDHTGMIGHWQCENAGCTIGVRADMDALWQWVDGEWRANHSCGHDAHMTMVFSALRCLKEIGFELTQGQIKVIFQPAEEVAEGALKMLDTGMLDDIHYLLGIHVRPLKELAFGQASSAIYHGGAACLKGVIQGRQAHAARPDDGINVIEAFARIVLAIQAVNANYSPGGSCKVTMAHVPNKCSNIIPDRLEFTLDLRSSTNAELLSMIDEVEQAAIEAGTLNQAQVKIEQLSKTVPAIPNAAMEQWVGEAITEVLGDQGWAPPVATPGAEDFHFYPTSLPSLQATMIGLGCGLVPGLHHPNMSFNKGALGTGTAIIALSIIKLFGHADIRSLDRGE